MAKAKKDADRRARIEQIRREAERAERRRTLMVVLACALVAVVIIAVTGYALLTRDDEATAASIPDGGSLGAAATAAGCSNVMVRDAEGLGDHRDGIPVEYAESPPAFGPHWNVTAEFARKFYTEEDRPEVERLVHNLEHGYTILWYDATVADDPDALSAVEDIAAEFEGSEDPTAKFIAVPWTSDDGEAFPKGKHVALTHWSFSGEAFSEGEVVEGQGQGQGVSLYCEQADDQVVTDFMTAFPYSDSPEPEGG